MRQDKLTTKFQEALADAQSLALGNDNPYIEPVHLLVAMLRQDDGLDVGIFEPELKRDHLALKGGGDVELDELLEDVELPGSGAWGQPPVTGVPAGTCTVASTRQNTLTTSGQRVRTTRRPSTLPPESSATHRSRHGTQSITFRHRG